MPDDPARSFASPWFLALVLGLAASPDLVFGAPDFVQPPVLRAGKGRLKAALEVKRVTSQIRNAATGSTVAFTSPTYAGLIPGPTLMVKPGNRLVLDIVNQLPPNPDQPRMGAFPHDPNTTNFHTHGLTVSPRGNSDNVLREMPPGTVNRVSIRIPPDHQSGTFWYHPHKHGSVTYQVFSGMAGFLIVKGGKGTLDALPEIKAAKDVVMGFQALRADATGASPWVYTGATQFGINPNRPAAKGLWSTLTNSQVFVTTNGVVNPTLYLRPGEVQRWRMLAAGTGEIFPVALQGHSLHVIANDGITVPAMRTLAPGDPYVLGSGQRADVLVKAGAPGTYLLQALDPAAAPGWSVISGSGIDPAPRQARISFDTPPAKYPTTLATIVVTDEAPIAMHLPKGPLPVPKGIPSIHRMLARKPQAQRQVVFENCGNQPGFSMQDPTGRLPSCGWYYGRYDTPYWGGTAFNTLLMMRDGDDTGVLNPADPNMPMIDFQKDGLFNESVPLFVMADRYEEWTLTNRSFSDHSFHIHQNPFLVTHVNGKALPVPEWHDTILVPAAQPQPGQTPQNINQATHGTVTFRTYYDPVTKGNFVMHCHMLQHEDIGMMQRVQVGKAQSQPVVHRH